MEIIKALRDLTKTHVFTIHRICSKISMPDRLIANNHFENVVFMKELCILISNELGGIGSLTLEERISKL